MSGQLVVLSLFFSANGFPWQGEVPLGEQVLTSFLVPLDTTHPNMLRVSRELEGITAPHDDVRDTSRSD
jgi:hypothetical protein